MIKDDKSIYRPIVSHGYEYVYPVAPDDFEKLVFDGSPRLRQWQVINIRFGAGLAGSAARRSDFPWLSGLGLVLRASAANALRPLIQRHAEFLRLVAIDGDEVYALNVTTVIDALDEDRSKALSRPRRDDHALQEASIQGPSARRYPPVQTALSLQPNIRE